MPDRASTPRISSCPRCGARVHRGDGFCFSCGLEVGELVIPDEAEEGRYPKTVARKLASWLIALPGGLALTAAITNVLHGHDRVDAMVRAAEQQLSVAGGDTRALHDEAARMHRRVDMGTGGALALAACYFGLWWWARTRPFAASLAALGLYVAALTGAVILDPRFLARDRISWLVITGLIIACVAAWESRPRGARGPAPS